MPSSNPAQSDKVSLSADIVAAYVSYNSVPPGGLPALIQSVHMALTSLGAVEAVPEPVALVPAVSIRRSITPEYLVCLDDGKEIQVPEKASRIPRHDARAIPSEMEAAERLPNDRIRICGKKVGDCEVVGTWDNTDGFCESREGRLRRLWKPLRRRKTSFGPPPALSVEAGMLRASQALSEGCGASQSGFGVE